VPQGFNYQAIARDGSGNPILNTPLPVTITIQSDSLGGTIFWKEAHSSVMTNGFGLFSVVIGKGTKHPDSEAAKFSDINWSVTPKFIKTEIYYQLELKNMGSSRLWTVPYSMVAGELGGSLDKLEVAGKTTSLEEALFEVKNKDGQIVFAVYNEGVRIYVDDAAKSPKGGFAIGGFGLDKADSQKYLWVTGDSIRMYLDSNPATKVKRGGFVIGGFDMTKGIIQNYLDISADSIRMYIDDTGKSKKGGFVIGGFDQVKGGNKNFLDVATDAEGIIDPAQNRILWYPIKNAFLAGNIRIGTPDSVGENSFSTGFRSKARGGYSQAMGFKAIANGNYSTAIGNNAIANSNNSFAFGEGARASNSESYAIGREAVASGYRSFAFGSAGVDTSGNPTDVVRALGDYSFAIGQGSQSIGKGSLGFGIANVASGNFSMAIGYKNSASGVGSTAIGYGTKASYYASTALGYFTTASGYVSTALGWFSTASNFYSTAMGFNSSAGGEGSTAMGYNTFAGADYSTALGNSTQAIGNSSTAMGGFSIASNVYSTALGFHTNASGGMSVASGNYTIASGDFSTAMGVNTKSRPYASLAIGRFNDETVFSATSWSGSDPLFICGNGTGSVGSNAFTVYQNGNANVQHNLEVGSWVLNNDRLDVFGGVNAGGWITYNNSLNRMVIGLIQSLPSNDDGAYCGWLNSGLGHSAGTLALITRSNESCDISFYTGNGTPTEKMTIISNGNIGIGTTTPGQKLDISAGNGRVQTGYSWLTNSDVRYKENIYTLEGCLEKVMAMRGVSFDLINDSLSKGFGRKNIGYIAQELEEVIPEVVVTGSDGYKSVAYDKITAVLTEAIKEQQNQIESFKQENQQLKSELDELKTLVNMLIANQSGQANK
jgi:hypothetical protein